LMQEGHQIAYIGKFLGPKQQVLLTYMQSNWGTLRFVKTMWASNILWIKS
jgi:hypothetical protein